MSPMIFVTPGVPVPAGQEADHVIVDGEWYEAPVPRGASRLVRIVARTESGEHVEYIPTGTFRTRPDGAVAQVWERKAVAPRSA